MNIDFEKYSDGLVPAIIQDARTRKVLMLGFMNQKALELTSQSGRVTFYSRSRQKLWTKGETSGNFLLVDEINTDCDGDTVLIKALPSGPVCHTGEDTCFGELNDDHDFLFKLEGLIKTRKVKPQKDSYTSELFSQGLNKIAQKVGEEAVELIIEAKDDDIERFKSEAADLLYHFMVLLSEKNLSYSDVIDVLRSRSVAQKYSKRR